MFSVAVKRTVTAAVKQNARAHSTVSKVVVQLCFVLHEYFCRKVGIILFYSSAMNIY